jgi:hypothetical protein
MNTVERDILSSILVPHFLSTSGETSMSCRSLFLAALLTTASLITANTSWAVPLDSSSFLHRYDGDTYGNPNLTGTNTAYTEFPGEDLGVWAPSSNGDILTYRNSIASGGGYFDNNEWDSTVNNAVGWTIEFRVKIGTDFDDDPTFGAFGLFAKENGSSSSTRRVQLWVGQDFTTLGSLNTTPINSGNNTDDFHVFRIAQPANSSNVTVWRDGVEIYTGISRGSNNTGLDMYFADGSSGIGGPTIQVDYFRWDSTGPYEPVPEPNSFVLIGVAAASAFGWARLRRKA